MSENIIKVKYKPRRDTEENWKTNNPILLDGELAITSDRYNMYKIGDGVSTWTQLEYSSNILVCTKEEYETKNANGEIKSGTIVIITDDDDYANIVGKVSKLDDIMDVDVSDATDGQVLTYDEENSKWIAKDKDIECGVQIVPFSTATDEQIKAMVDAYYAGEITLDDVKSVWSVGDTRNITLSAMEATGVRESHAEQTVELTIIDFDHDDLETSVNGKTKALITVQLKNCLNETGYMNSTFTNSGGWEESSRRNWCNNVFKNSIPLIIKDSIKNVHKENYKVYNSTTLSTTSDNCFLLSETEMFGTKTYSVGDTEGTQYDYYKIESNRIKQVNGNNCEWWLRTPAFADHLCFCCVYLNGDPGGKDAIYDDGGISPAFCL